MDAHDRLSLCRSAAQRLALLGPSEKREALLAMADALETHAVRLVAAGRPLPGAGLVDQDHLDRGDFQRLAQDVRVVARAPDPIGNLLEARRGPDGVEISRISVPLGVIALWFRNRPALTAVATALAVKSGNGLVLAGPGALHPISQTLYDVLLEAGLGSGLPIGFLESCPGDLGSWLGSPDPLDLLVVRDDPEDTLLDQVRVPTLHHQPGTSSLYVDVSADLEVASTMLWEGALQDHASDAVIRRVLLHEESLESFLELNATRLREGMVSLVADSVGLVALRHLEIPCSPPPGLGMSPTLEISCVQSDREALGTLNRSGPRALDAVATSDWSVARRFERESQAVCVSLNTVPPQQGVNDLPAGFDLGTVTRGRHVRGPIGLHALTSARLVMRR